MRQSRQRRSDKRHGLMRRHGLSLGVAAVLVLWMVLYRGADPQTHLGGFYGNAIADWLGTLIIVIATKYLYEIGSAESRPPHPRSRRALTRFLIDHSLTLALVVTGVIWCVVYARMDATGKMGQVVGNIVSEWTQILGLVLITKYARETGSKS